LDVIVTTPHLIASIAEADPYVFCRVTHLVIDEADSLFDKSFAPSTMKVIERTAPTLKKLILCSATIPRSLDSYLRSNFPEIKRLVTPNLHAIPRRVQLGVVDVDKPPYQGNRNMACADVIWSLGKAGSADDDMAYKLTGTSQPKNIIVFVNKRETAEEVAQYLVSKGVNAVALSRDMAEKRQKEIMAEFTILPPLPSPEDAKMLRKSKSKYWSDIPFETADSKSRESVKRLENTNVLVVTDLGSRGIDTVTVKTVILYDVPHTSIDFIHRLGRVGRMNRRGRGVVLVGKKDRKDIVREVREAMFKGQALI
jgi:ATP-dependent RNA helicase MRH4